jgi:parallel beta-helix repeat protein/predicted outer membrane repeat protein
MALLAPGAFFPSCGWLGSESQNSPTIATEDKPAIDSQAAESVTEEQSKNDPELEPAETVPAGIAQAVSAPETSGTIADPYEMDDDSDLYTEIQGDCDDAVATVNPAATEVCDGVDNNCNGDIDDEDALVDGQTTYYADVDGDGFGNIDISIDACDQQPGYSNLTGDCDDQNTNEPSLFVNVDGTNRFLTIQDAINAASAGNCIAVFPGTYQENISITAPVTLASTGGRKNTIIDGSLNSLPVITIDLSGYTGTLPGAIIGFTIENGGGSYGGGISGSTIQNGFEISHNMIKDNSVHHDGGGIFLTASNGMILNDNIITNNFALDGGGMYVENSMITVSNSAVSINSADLGGGLLIISNSEAELNNTTISANQAYSAGGGIFVDGESALILSNNDISDNSADALNGGGIYSNLSDLILSGNTISDNTAGVSGGAIYCYSGSYPAEFILSGNVISGNSATSSGGGIHSYACIPEATDNLFSRNDSTSGSGGALFSTIGGTITNNLFSDNSAFVSGGAIQFAYSSAIDSLRNNIFGRNNAALGNAINVSLTHGSSILNNIFYANGNLSDFENDGVISLESANSSSTNVQYILNNLFAFNNGSDYGSVYRDVGFDIDLVVANNIVYNSVDCGMDLNMGGTDNMADYNLFYEVNNDPYCGETEGLYGSFKHNIMDQDPLLALSIDESLDADGNGIPDALDTNDYLDADFMISGNLPAVGAGMTDFNGDGIPEDLDGDGSSEDWDRDGSADTDLSSPDMGPHGGIYGESW